MLQTFIIGNVGADAEKKESNGKKFTTFRVAHNERWRDQSGQEHSNTMWIDCIMNDHPNVADYIKQGQTVAIIGDVRLRVYSSEKDRCMKAGMTINVRQVELVGGATDTVPNRLYDANGGMHNVNKAYYSDVKGTQLTSMRGQKFNVDENGWILPEQETASETSNKSDNDQVF